MKPIKKLKKFVEDNLDKLDWKSLSRNENATQLLEKYQDIINWDYLSYNQHLYSLPQG